eukprot:jgi/Mesvir1/25156/Mv18836-RA.1
MTTKQEVDNLFVRGAITFANGSKLDRLNPLPISFGFFQSTYNRCNKPVLEYRIANAAAPSGYDIFFQVGGEDVEEPPDDDYTLTYLRIAKDMLSMTPPATWDVTSLSWYDGAPTRSSAVVSPVSLLETELTARVSALVPTILAAILELIDGKDPSMVVRYSSRSAQYPSWAFDPTFWTWSRLTIDYYDRVVSQTDTLIAVAHPDNLFSSTEHKYELWYWSPQYPLASLVVGIYLPDGYGIGTPTTPPIQSLPLEGFNGGILGAQFATPATGMVYLGSVTFPLTSPVDSGAPGLGTQVINCFYGTGTSHPSTHTIPLILTRPMAIADPMLLVGQRVRCRLYLVDIPLEYVFK